MDSEEKWYINKIVAEKFCHHDYGITKWFQIKYTEYVILE